MATRSSSELPHDRAHGVSGVVCGRSKVDSSAHCRHVSSGIRIKATSGASDGNNLQDIVGQSQRLVQPDLVRRAGRDLSRMLVDGNRVEGLIIIVVDGLEDGMRTLEDRKGAATDVCLSIAVLLAQRAHAWHRA